MALATAVAIGLLWLVRPRRVAVVGRSMEPTVVAGDRLIVVRVRRPRRGAIVALRDPRHSGRLLVKRVLSRGPDGVVVEGDRRWASTDSRAFGPVAPGAVVGRVVYRYAPPTRRGRLGSARSVWDPDMQDIGAATGRGTIAAVTSLDEELEPLFAPDYLEGVEGKSLEEVRAMRAECQEAETVVSYLRRVVQGRLDIVHSFLDHQSSGESVADLDAVVDDLSSIIGSGPARPQGYGRLPSQMSPDMERVDLTSEIDDVLNAEGIGRLPTMSAEDLREVAGGLTVIEQRISDQRRTLHERIDHLQAEIVSRYKTGEATVDGLLS